MFDDACIIFCFRNLWYHHYSTCVQDLSAGGASWGCHIASGGYSARQTVPWYCWWVEDNRVIYCKPTFLHMIEISQHLRVPLGGNISLSKPCTTSGKLQCLKNFLLIAWICCLDLPSFYQSAKLNCHWQHLYLFYSITGQIMSPISLDVNYFHVSI